MNYFIYSNPHKIKIPLRLLDEVLDYLHQTVWFLIDFSSIKPVESYSNILDQTTVSFIQSKATLAKFQQHYFDATIKINEQLQKLNKTKEGVNFTSKLYFYREKQSSSWWSNAEKIPYLLISLRFEILKDGVNFKQLNLNDHEKKKELID